MAEQLITKLSVKGCNLSSVGRGVTAITNYDIAASLAYGNLPKLTYYYARAKYCEDVLASQNLLVLLNETVREKLCDLNLKFNNEIIAGISKLMLIEAVFGNQCKTCDGLGYAIEENQIEVCSRCSSTGINKLSQRKRAEIVGVSLSKWHRDYDKYIPEIYQSIQNLQRDVIKHVYYQVNGED
ncbi:hypothetical protein [Pleionea sediminis]|uniref:hypothetical protein n=1 Tax=Pleionea sediminis TaxID=2569479 RepID=UPI0011849A9E|nr:hypothetical protein [Pleionea sediminis]